MRGWLQIWPQDASSPASAWRGRKRLLCGFPLPLFFPSCKVRRTREPLVYCTSAAVDSKSLRELQTFSVGFGGLWCRSRPEMLSPPGCCDRLGGDWVRLVGVDAEILDGFVDDAALDFAVLEKFVERGQADRTSVDFKEIPEGLAPFTAPEAVGAKGGQPARH